MIMYRTIIKILEILFIIYLNLRYLINQKMNSGHTIFKILELIYSETLEFNAYQIEIEMDFF